MPVSRVPVSGVSLGCSPQGTDRGLACARNVDWHIPDNRNTCIGMCRTAAGIEGDGSRHSTDERVTHRGRMEWTGTETTEGAGV